MVNPLARPKYAHVCIDPGHGYRLGLLATGAREPRKGGLIEDDVVFGTLNVNGTEMAHGLADRLGWTLRGHGHKVTVTRGKSLVGINKRAAIAVKAGCDLFVSIHCNAAASDKARGIEILVAEGDTRSYELAEKVLDALKKALPNYPQRGVKWDTQGQHKSLGVLRGTCKHMPAMLIEAGFLTNIRDAALLKERIFRSEFILAIAKVIRGIA